MATSVTAPRVGAFLGFAFVLLLLGSRALGWLMQRTLTVAVDFERARLERVVRTLHHDGRICLQVHLDVTLPRA